MLKDLNFKLNAVVGLLDIDPAFEKELEAFQEQYMFEKEKIIVPLFDCAQTVTESY